MLYFILEGEACAVCKLTFFIGLLVLYYQKHKNSTLEVKYTSCDI